MPLLFVLYNLLIYWIISPFLMLIRCSWIFKGKIEVNTPTKQIQIPKSIDSFTNTQNQNSKDMVCSLFDSAQRRIYIATCNIFITRMDETDFTYHMLKKLQEAALRGVDVIVFYDATLNRFTQTGVDVSKEFPQIQYVKNGWNPPFQPYRCFHRKYMIVDDYVYLTSGNLNALHYGTGANMVDNIHLTTNPEFLKIYLEIFDHDLVNYRESVIVDTQHRIHYVPNLCEYFIDRFTSATKSIIIMSQYFDPPDEIVDVLLAALKRGVSIDVYLNTGSILPNIDPLRAKLSKIGIRFHIFHADYIKHTKMCFIDEDLAILGSFNFSYRTLVMDYENIQEYSGADLIPIRHIFDGIAKDYKVYSPRWYDSLPGTAFYPSFISYVF